MELPFPSTFFSFLFIVFLLVKLRNAFKTSSPSASRLPPGPWKLPIIGSIHHLSGSLLHHTLRDLAKKHGPLMHLKLGEVSTVVVSSPETAKEVMKIHDLNFASRPIILATELMSYGAANITFSPYGDYWRQLRKMCVFELLSTKRVRLLRSVREGEVASLINSLVSANGSPVNLTEKLYSTAYTTTSKGAFGNEAKDQQTFISIVKELTRIASGFNLTDLYPSIKVFQWTSGIRQKLGRLQQQTDKMLENIINEHIEAKTKMTCEGGLQEDLVDILLKFQDEGVEFQLKKDNIKAVLLDIFIAGSETSATTVDWAMSEMLKNTRIMEKAQDEVRRVFSSRGSVDETEFYKLDYMKSVIKETLRMHPPAPLLLPRECRQKCKIQGYDIQEKTRVIVNAWAIGRDPRYWEEAECFYPERFLDSPVDYKGTDFEYIPFGSGRRVCPGMSYGIASVELLLANLLYHFDWKLPHEIEELDLTEAFGVTVRRKDDLFVIPIPHYL
ncbi:cytochrome P450 71D9-like [Apium graveolens]|uniref:cytochrome P450 71D9-like n=1 Tax=Apium graveolens TaxID=4045 RepID=UPI003D7BD130